MLVRGIGHSPSAALHIAQYAHFVLCGTSMFVFLKKLEIECIARLRTPKKLTCITAFDAIYSVCKKLLAWQCDRQIKQLAVRDPH